MYLLLIDFKVEGYWDECLALPSKLKDKDAYNDLKGSLQNYLEVFPLLKALNSKVKPHMCQWSLECFFFTPSSRKIQTPN